MAEAMVRVVEARCPNSGCRAGMLSHYKYQPLPQLVPVAELRAESLVCNRCGEAALMATEPVDEVGS